MGNVAQHGHIGNVDILCNVADAVAAHPGAGDGDGRWARPTRR